ncbi:hypothetical protein D3C85_1112560 [compost metagenome]
MKSFLDVSVQDGFKVKDLNEGLQEFGLRIVLNKANEKLVPNKANGKVYIDQGQRYLIDIIKKVEQKKAKEALKPN